MKKTSKIISALVLTLCISLAFCLPGFAAGEPAPLEIGVDNIGELAVENNPSLKITISSILNQPTFNEIYINSPYTISDAKGKTSYAAVGMVLSYYELSQARSELASSIELLELKYKTTQILSSINGASALDLQRAKADLDSAKNSLSSLDQSISSLLGSINLFLGRSFSEPIVIKPFEPVDIKEVQARDAEKDLKKALGSSNDIKIAEATLSRLYSSRDFDEFLGDYSNPTFYDAAIKSQLMNIKSLKQTLEKNFRELDQSLAQQILDLQAAELSLSLAEKNLAIETVKYNIGMTPLAEYKNAQLTLLSAQGATSKAQRTLYSSWERYKWYLNGVDVSSKPSQQEKSD